jgi:hypothetical protein
MTHSDYLCYRKARRAQVAGIQDWLAKIEKILEHNELEADDEDFD